MTATPLRRTSSQSSSSPSARPARPVHLAWPARPSMRCSFGARAARTLATILGSGVVTLTVAAAARADTKPNVWDAARDPSQTETYRLHVEVQRRLSQLGDVGVAQRYVLRTILENADAEHSPDVRLRFDLGRVYLALGSDDPDNFARAARVLRDALRAAPDHPMAEDGFLNLAFACGHTGDHACERDAYVQVLRRSTEDVLRATPTLNLAETSMHLGNLRDAAEGYREALRIAGRVPALGDTAPLAVWGLAVALDRSGDHLAAENEARLAIQLERSMGMTGPVSQILHSSSVFFVPAYEIHWYDALSARVLAKDAKKPSEAAYYWTVAERALTSYVRQAEAKGDRWLEIAKARLAEVSAARAHAPAPRANEKANRALPDDPDEAEVSL